MAEIRWAEETAEKILEKELETAKRNAHKVPYRSYDGVYEDLSGERIGWWTNGFWGGILWQLYHASGDAFLKDAAVELEEKMDAALMNADAMDHDSGFRFLLTAGADYTLTGSKAAYNRLRLAADNLAGRFNTAGEFIQAWNNWGDTDRSGWAIIDCMMNLPLLYKVGELLKNPRYKQTAMKHADTTIRYFIREDGSSNHIDCFDSATGEYLDTLPGQGAYKGSSWTRGQAWALYGFMFSYLHTKEQRYLDTCRKVADYWISCIPESGLIPCDFRQPADCDYEDATAAAIASCGLIELSKVCEGEDGEKYLNAAIRMLQAMAEKRADWDPSRDGILTHCTAAYGDQEHNFHMMYADYYFIEAIWKLTGREVYLW